MAGNPLEIRPQTFPPGLRPYRPRSSSRHLQSRPRLAGLRIHHAEGPPHGKVIQGMPATLLPPNFSFQLFFNVAADVSPQTVVGASRSDSCTESQCGCLRLAAGRAGSVPLPVMFLGIAHRCRSAPTPPMQPPVQLEKLEALMSALGRSVKSPGRVYLTGGATALLHGWRPVTVEVVLKADPEPAGFFEAMRH